MRFVVAESGFCHGVKAAVHSASVLSDGLKSGMVYFYGDLVNNRHVMTRFVCDGFIVVQSAEEIKAGSVVVIRAHGVGQEVYEKL